jgi:hypothetical protein
MSDLISSIGTLSIYIHRLIPFFNPIASCFSDGDTKIFYQGCRRTMSYGRGLEIMTRENIKLPSFRGEVASLFLIM